MRSWSMNGIIWQIQEYNYKLYTIGTAVSVTFSLEFSNCFQLHFPKVCHDVFTWYWHSFSYLQKYRNLMYGKIENSLLKPNFLLAIHYEIFIFRIAGNFSKSFIFENTSANMISKTIFKNLLSKVLIIFCFNKWSLHVQDNITWGWYDGW